MSKFGAWESRVFKRILHVPPRANFCALIWHMTPANWARWAVSKSWPVVSGQWPVGSDPFRPPNPFLTGHSGLVIGHCDNTVLYTNYTDAGCQWIWNNSGGLEGRASPAGGDDPAQEFNQARMAR